MISPLIKILLLGFLAVVAAKSGITFFYKLFPPELSTDIDNIQAIKASIVGIICATPFLFLLIKSIDTKMGKRKLRGKRSIKVNSENLNETDSFYNGVRELKRK